MRNIGSSFCSGLQKSQMAQLGTGLGSTTCASMSADCAGSIPDSAWQGVVNTCVNQLSKDAVHALGSGALGSIPSGVMSNFPHIGSLNASACTGFTSSQLSKLGDGLGSSACKRMEAACVHNIPAKSFDQLNTGCFSQLSSNAFSGFTHDQVEKLPASLFSSVSASKIAALSSNACSGFTATQVFLHFFFIFFLQFFFFNFFFVPCSQY